MSISVPDNITALLNRVGHRIYQPLIELRIEAWVSKEPLSFNDKAQGEYRVLTKGDSWGRYLKPMVKTQRHLLI